MNPTDVFCALADETRARLCLLISQEHELCVCELTAALDAPQPRISRHLALLRQAGLLSDRRQGQWVYYRLHDALPEWVREMLAMTQRANTEWLKHDLQRLERMGMRPGRQAVCCDSP